MKNGLLTALLLLLAAAALRAQTPEKPRLIIGIVVDQMRYDFLYRYENRYGAGGFKRLLRDGFSCENTHYNYTPTYTGPGHAAIYTGTTPAVNGVIANEWWDPSWKKHRYVTTDPRYQGVGATGKVGQHSPAVLLSSTITDELRLSNNFASKVAGVCIKDRGSILPAGHIANACYWFDDASGNWITSTYYPDSLGLPRWVQAFNERKLPDQYLSGKWDKLLPVEYTESFKGWNKYEEAHYGDIRGDFPHDLAAYKQKSGNSVLRFTPFANTLTLDFALETIENMELGADATTDFLCLSFSATDYAGHQFGIHSEEVEDVYLRLDADIARLLDYLDKKFGRNNCLVFLSADHGAAETPRHQVDINMPAGVFPESKLKKQLEDLLTAQFGASKELIYEVSNQQVWINWSAVTDLGLDTDDVIEVIVKHLRSRPGVYDALSRADLASLPADYPFAAEIRRGIYPHRSGDIIFQLEPGWHPDDQLFLEGGTTHGSSYAYDTHVPLVWYGWKVRPGATHAPVSITDIAPTLAAMLRIMEPNGTTGAVIQDLLKP